MGKIPLLKIGYSLMSIPHFDVARLRVTWGWLHHSDVGGLLVAEVARARNFMVADARVGLAFRRIVPTR